MDNKIKYPSRYSPEKEIFAAQYIIELVCEKRAKLEGNDLTVQFWKEKKWAQFFKSQLRMCYRLLKRYSEVAIIKALKDSRAYRVNSLFAPWLIPIIEEEQAKIDLSKNSQTIKIPNKNLPDHRPDFIGSTQEKIEKLNG